MRLVIHIALAILVTRAAAAEPVYQVDTSFSSTFSVDDGSTITDRHLDEYIHRGITWHRIYHLGKLFWARNDTDGNVVLTWDWVDYLDEATPAHEFILAYKNPILGKEWNPDGVTIRIDAVDEEIAIKGQSFRCARYSFILKDGTIAVSTWVSDGVGAVKMVRIAHGTTRTYELDLGEISP